MIHATIERSLAFDDINLARELFGPQNSHLAMLAKAGSVDLQTHGSKLTLRAITEHDASLMVNLLSQLYNLLKAGYPLFPRDMCFALKILFHNPSTDLRDIFQDTVFVVSPKKTISPKTLSQKELVQAVRDNDVVFAIGPAGTGKTYLAVAMAVAALTERTVKRLILTRPAVETGEHLGFLPGDLREKVNPYLRPLYDALHDMLDQRKIQEMLDNKVIEIAPLAFMRGRTLSESFIILDEGQNTTPEQMKMFLTRLGFGSKIVVTGDITQIDLHPVSRVLGSERSGLVHAELILAGIKGLYFIHLNEQDVVRHPLVAQIAQSYERTVQSAA
ncbi:PhoH-like protein [Desulfovibrionales bacterium]